MEINTQKTGSNPIYDEYQDKRNMRPLAHQISPRQFNQLNPLTDKMSPYNIGPPNQTNYPQTTTLRNVSNERNLKMFPSPNNNQNQNFGNMQTPNTNRFSHANGQNRQFKIYSNHTNNHTQNTYQNENDTSFNQQKDNLSPNPNDQIRRQLSNTNNQPQQIRIRTQTKKDLQVLPQQKVLTNPSNQQQNQKSPNQQIPETPSSNKTNETGRNNQNIQQNQNQQKNQETPIQRNRRTFHMDGQKENTFQKFDYLIKSKENKESFDKNSQDPVQKKISPDNSHNVKTNRAFFQGERSEQVVNTNRISTISTNNGSVNSGGYHSTYTPHVESLLSAETDYENFQISKVLGFGSYAIVKLATHKPTSVKVAIKSYEKKSLEDPMKFKNVQREIKILFKLKHPNIIRLFQVLESPKYVNLIMEYMPNLPLNDYMKCKQEKKLSEDEAKNYNKMNTFQVITSQLADALAYCHKKWVVHRDIKLENILIGYDLKVKLIDFGFAVVVPPQHYLSIFCGTPSYMAPEIVNKGQYTYPVDTWALGVLLFKVISGTFPYKGQSDEELYRKINSCKPDYPIHFTNELMNLLNNIFIFEQDVRMRSDFILHDNWIQNINMSKIENNPKFIQKFERIMNDRIN